MIENLQNELHQLENKQTNKQNVLNFLLTLESGGRKMHQKFLQSTWKTEYEKSNNFWIIYWS